MRIEIISQIDFSPFEAWAMRKLIDETLNVQFGKKNK